MPIDDFPGDTPPGQSTGKFILLSVPNFNNAPQTGDQMSSYLRIGATDPATTPGRPPVNPGVPNVDPTGEDLASVVTDFADDTRRRQPPGGQTPSPPAPGESLPQGSTATPDDDTEAMRTHESALLHLKGGWRDHSDGNRVTTTRGDKLEVIRGNYRMVVLGRRDPYPAAAPPGTTPDLANAAGWDVSGGLVDATDTGNTSDQTALSTEYVWAANSDNRWGWTSRTTIGNYDTSALNGNGKTVSYTWVDESWAFVGSPRLDPNADQTVNPEAFVASGTGSAPRPVKKMVSKAWAETIVQETHASQIPQPSNPPTTASFTSTTTSDGPMTTVATSTGDMTVTSTAQGAMVTNSTSTGDMTVDATSTGAMFTTSTSHGDMHSTSQSDGVLTTRQTSGGSMTNWMEAQGSLSNGTRAHDTMIETVVGNSLHLYGEVVPISISLMMAALFLELKIIHLDVHLGIHFDFHIGLHFDMRIGWHYQSSQGSMSMADDTLTAVAPVHATT